MRKERQAEGMIEQAPTESSSRWPPRRRPRRIARRIGGHVESRISFGVLTLSTLGFVAAAVLILTGVIGGIVYLADNEKLHALAFLLASLGLAALAAGFGIGMGFIGLPIVGDWFLEWQSHALGWGIGAAGCALLTMLLFLTPLPAYVSLLLALVVVFGAGYVLAYSLRATPPVKAGGRKKKR